MTTRTIYRYLLVALVLLVAAQGCTLSTSDDATPPPGFIRTLTPTYSLPTPPFTIPTTTPLPTQTLTPEPTEFNCRPYTWWPVYLVQAGDTLSVIAALTGTTVQELVTGNCLLNPDAIYVGQPLYVPRLPPTPVPVPTDTPTLTPDPGLPVFTSPLTVSQHWIRNDGWAVTYFHTVRVSTGPVTNATAVSFFVNDPVSSQAQFIGQDNTPLDGASVDYAFPALGTYTFMAQAEVNGLGVPSSPFTIIYDPTYNPPE